MFYINIRIDAHIKSIWMSRHVFAFCEIHIMTIVETITFVYLYYMIDMYLMMSCMWTERNKKVYCIVLNCIVFGLGS